MFTLAKFVCETVSDSDTKQYLPWPRWVTEQEIETILSVLHRPRWPRQVLYCVAVAGIIAYTLPIETWLNRWQKCIQACPMHFYFYLVKILHSYWYSNFYNVKYHKLLHPFVQQYSDHSTLLSLFDYTSSNKKTQAWHFNNFCQLFLFCIICKISFQTFENNLQYKTWFMLHNKCSIIHLWYHIMPCCQSWYHRKICTKSKSDNIFSVAYGH